MSNLPGLTLEAYLCWEFDLVVEGEPEANISVGMAEAVGLAPRIRKVLTQEQFKQIVNRYEDQRNLIEYAFENFDDEDQSWRAYAGYAFSEVDLYGHRFDWVRGYLKTLEKL